MSMSMSVTVKTSVNVSVSVKQVGGLPHSVLTAVCLM